MGKYERAKKGRGNKEKEERKSEKAEKARKKISKEIENTRIRQSSTVGK